MADTPNYNESTVAGTSWTRCMNVSIDNQYGHTPSMVLFEEKIYVLEGGKIIREPVGNLSVAFDTNIPAHQQIYDVINSEYVRLRELRDNTNVAPPDVPPADPPVDPPVEQPA